MIFKFVHKRLGAQTHFILRVAEKIEHVFPLSGSFILDNEDVLPFLNMLRRGSGAGGTVVIQEET